MLRIACFLLLWVVFCAPLFAQTGRSAPIEGVDPNLGSAGLQISRVLSGVVITNIYEAVPDVLIEVETADGIIKTTSDSEGKFSLRVPSKALSVKFSGKNIEPKTRMFGPDEKIADLRVRIEFVVPPVVESVNIQADALAPMVDSKSGSVISNTLFGRDDQLIQSLNAGINAGQHEGGGKSLEIRRYGFNSDHGGVNGGLKILVDNVQQNQGTQGHGQGYLGNLKSVIPELIEEVTIINGPFSAGYGDFSGLGVVLINSRESLPDLLTFRIQGGNHNTLRTFTAVSPKIKNAKTYVAHEYAGTDGPFEAPLGYRRNNFSGSFTLNASNNRDFGARFSLGTNKYASSGQIPLDLVSNGSLGRFGTLDPDNGGTTDTGTIKGFYRQSFASGTTIKADAFVTRSLFDLYSNFTFFLSDPVYGDEIQQHDSRLIEGGNLQVFYPYKIGDRRAVLTFGGDVLLNQVNVGLYPSVGRNPNRKFLPGNVSNPDVLLTRANANISNAAGYVQNSISFFDGHLSLETGLRWDVFKYTATGMEISDAELRIDGSVTETKLQPKISLSWSPIEDVPVSFYANYGRGIASQDARSVVKNPDAPPISTTDFYQFGTSFNDSAFSGVFTGFLIERSNEQVYIPDDGSIELAGPTRSYGFELKGSARVNRNVVINGSVTRVVRSYFKDSNPREFVVSAPHTVANAGLVLSDLFDTEMYLNWRHISNYRLDGFDESLRASGHDVVDFALKKRIRNWVDLNFSVDNLFNKSYYETQNFFESRVTPTSPILERIHATPGYSTTVSIGVTFRFGQKD
ncbi:MAG: TonB-dependent receptor [Pyrinomonadaceae bacterium]|nr:TonB-dependent receptor [Pyrinomonadaceae bacterium]